MPRTYSSRGLSICALLLTIIVLFILFRRPPVKGNPDNSIPRFRDAASSRPGITRAVSCQIVSVELRKPSSCRNRARRNLEPLSEPFGGAAPTTILAQLLHDRVPAVGAVHKR